jgi:alkylation response protein AidB-like acyl-CoA dehydrogenase
MAAVAEQLTQNEISPRLKSIDAGDFDTVVALLERCGELGLLGADVPERDGGLGLDKATSALIGEKLGPGGSFAVAFMAHTGIGTLPLVYYGTEEQKEKYLPGLLSGETPAAYCLTEPGAGSDALGVKTVAVKSGDEFVLDGTKQFITNGGFAKVFTVFARADRDRFTGFLVERDTPGLTVGPEEKKLGIKGSSTTQIILEGAKVPAANLLGEMGKGHKIAFNVLNVGRFKLAALAMGAAKAALAEAVRYAGMRKQFGTAIASFGAVREKIADMTAAIFAAESMVYRIAGLIDARLARIPAGSTDHSALVQRGIEEFAGECAIAKVYCSEALAEVADEALQVHGGYGYTQEYEAERYYRDERINRIFEGTNEVNRLLVPTTLLRRARGPLRDAAARAGDMLRASARPAAGSPERAALAGMKSAFLACAGAAMDRLGPKLEEDQVVLLPLADLAIQIFAAESAILRAEKAGAGQPLLQDAAKVAAFRAVESAAAAARKAIWMVGDRAASAGLVRAVGEVAFMDGSGLREARDRLVAAAMEKEQYPL